MKKFSADPWVLWMIFQLEEKIKFEKQSNKQVKVHWTKVFFRFITIAITRWKIIPFITRSKYPSFHESHTMQAQTLFRFKQNEKLHDYWEAFAAISPTWRPVIMLLTHLFRSLITLHFHPNSKQQHCNFSAQHFLYLCRTEDNNEKTRSNLKINIFLTRCNFLTSRRFVQETWFIIIETVAGPGEEIHIQRR